MIYSCRFLSEIGIYRFLLLFLLFDLNTGIFQEQTPDKIGGEKDCKTDPEEEQSADVVYANACQQKHYDDRKGDMGVADGHDKAVGNYLLDGKLIGNQNGIKIHSGVRTLTCRDAACSNRTHSAANLPSREGQGCVKNINLIV